MRHRKRPRCRAQGPCFNPVLVDSAEAPGRSFQPGRRPQLGITCLTGTCLHRPNSDQGPSCSGCLTRSCLRSGDLRDGRGSYQDRPRRSPCQCMTSVRKVPGRLRHRSPTWRWLWLRRGWMCSPGGRFGIERTMRVRAQPKPLYQPLVSDEVSSCPDRVKLDIESKTSDHFSLR